MRRCFAVLLFCLGIFCLAQSNAQVAQTGAGSPKPATSGGGSTTAFDPSNTNASIALSNGNLTGTNTYAVNGAYGNTQSIASHSTGKFFNEFTLTTLDPNAYAVPVGLITTSGGGASLNPGLGFDASISLGYYAGNGVMSFNSAVITGGSIQTSAQGDVVGMAVDIGGALIWIRTNAGNWNNSGTANPATGAGGISISGLLTNPISVAVSIFQQAHNLSSVTANFGATSYAHSAPAGFGNW